MAVLLVGSQYIICFSFAKLKLFVVPVAHNCYPICLYAFFTQDVFVYKYITVFVHVYSVVVLLCALI